MYELLIYTRFTILRSTGTDRDKLEKEAMGYSQALEWIIYLEGSEVHRHVNMFDEEA